MVKWIKSLEPASKKSKKRQCVVHYAGLGPYSELKDVNEEKEARLRAAKAKQQTLKDRNYHEEQCLLVPGDIQDQTNGVHMTLCYKNTYIILLFWLVNHQENKVTCGYQRVQLGERPFLRKTLRKRPFKFHEHCRKDFSRPKKSCNLVSWIFFSK